MKSAFSVLVLLMVVAVLFVPSQVWAGSVRVLPAGTVPEDRRLRPLRDLNSYSPFRPPTSIEEWEKRSELMRRRILVSLGLWPLPTRTPLNTVIHGKMDRGDYTVEKVYFESVPGFFVTGNLYRPKSGEGRMPGVLCPHGHWSDGRFVDHGEETARKEIANGAERFEEGGRSVLQSRCVQLARMGCVVFHYDMIGYADSVQLSFALAHRFGRQRPEMNTPENWGLFSPQAESHLQSVMGLQAWNSIRALDFLESLPDVDPKRLACTGASGGGTQTFILSAIEPRVSVSFPAVMVGTAMQGGCTCENACLLRIGVGNVGFAALFAPKPLGLTSADDWTKEMSSKGFPELQKLYELLDASENVMLKRLEHFGHNYNFVSRTAMYSWMNRHLELDLPEPILERDYQRLTRAEMSVWDEEHPAPKAADPDFERGLVRWWHEDVQRQFVADRDDPDRFKQSHGKALEIVLNGGWEDVGEAEWEMIHKLDRVTWLEMSGLVRNKTYGEELPTVFCYPKEWNGHTVIWLSADGKSGLHNADGSLVSGVDRLVQSGVTVVGVDLLYQGEFLSDRKPLEHAPRVKNNRQAAAYTLGYNPAVFAQRVHDVLTLVKFIQSYERRSEQLSLVGLDGAGHWAAAARAVSSRAVDSAVIDTRGFRFGEISDIRSMDLLPGGAKYGDLPGMLALAAPGRLWVAGETPEGLALVREQYKNADAASQLTVFAEDEAEVVGGAVEYLLR